MFHQMFNATPGAYQSDAPAGSKKSKRSMRSKPGKTNTARRNLITFLRSSMLVSGIAAMTALALMFIKPELTHQVHVISPFSKEASVSPITQTPPTAVTAVTATQSPVSDQKASLLPDTKQQQSVTNWLAKRYRVAHDAAHIFVSTAYLTAHELKLDPLLILSVMAIESGLNPYAESPVGAQGLMQVMSKIHEDKFDELGGIKEALNPVANIRVGAQILKEYVKRGGSVEAGLKMYVGAAAAENDGGYGHKVLAEYRRLKDVSDGKPVSIFNSPVAAAKPAVIKVNRLLT